MKEWSKNKWKALAIMGWVFFASLAGALALGVPIKEKPVEFWFQAPDGIYEVWVSVVNPDVVWFPLCPTSPSQLHGDFQYSETLELIEATFYEVWLQDNIIIHAIKLY